MKAFLLTQTTITSIQVYKKKNCTKYFFHKIAVVNEDQNLNYYQEYCRLFIANVVLTTQVNFFLPLFDSFI